MIIEIYPLLRRAGNQQFSIRQNHESVTDRVHSERKMGISILSEAGVRLSVRERPDNPNNEMSACTIGICPNQFSIGKPDRVSMKCRAAVTLIVGQIGHQQKSVDIEGPVDLSGGQNGQLGIARKYEQSAKKNAKDEMSEVFHTGNALGEVKEGRTI